MFPEDWRIPLDRWIDDAFAWLLANFQGVLDAVKGGLLSALRLLDDALLAAPWWAVILILGALAFWGSRRVSVTLGVMAAMMLIGLLGLWALAMQTLSLMIISVALSILLGFPAGLGMAYSDVFRNIMRPVLDVMQTMPIFVYLIPVIMLFGLGKVPAILATVIYAAPPLIRLTDLGIRHVDAEVVEAADAFGATWSQKLLGVQLPLALPTLMAGLNQTTMLALSMVVVASMIGVQGLGQEVLAALNRLEVGRGAVAGLAIVLLAIVLDRVTQAYGRRTQASLEEGKLAGEARQT